MDLDFLNNISEMLGDKSADNDDLFDKEAEVVERFVSNYEFLSNFHMVPQKSTVYYEDEDGNIEASIEECKSVEHAFQANKTTNREQQLEILNAVTAKQAKRLGKKVDLIENWDEKKVGVMERLLDDKFIQNFPLKLKLLATGMSELQEGNSWGDTFWGITKKGGNNNLGILLMKMRRRIVRDEGEILYHVSNVFDRQGLGFVVDWIDESKIRV